MNAQAPRSPSSRLYRRIIIAVAALIIIIIIFKNIFVILQPTERGIVFRKWTSGLDVEHVRDEGLNLMAPWNEMIVFDISKQQIEETMDVLSIDALTIFLDVSVRYKVKEDEIGYLYQSFKKGYVENLIIPEIRSGVRKIIGQHTPQELYSTKREEIENAIINSAKPRLDSNHVELVTILVRSIKLPDAIKKSIEDKLAAEQESQKREYLLQIAEKDAKIRITEARGKAEANRILNASLTDRILKEKGISATEALAKSPNAKIVVIGSGKEGLPLILGGD